VKPLVSFVAILLSNQHEYDDTIINLKSGYFYCMIVNNISITVTKAMLE